MAKSSAFLATGLAKPAPLASNLCQGDLYLTKEIHILARRQAILEQAGP